MSQAGTPVQQALDTLMHRVFRAEVLDMHAYVVAPAEGLIKLDAMENPFGLPTDLATALAERLAGIGLNRYPPGDLSGFRARLGKAFGMPAGVALTLGNGSDELIHLLTQACARPGACVLSAWPSFTMYRLSSVLNGCRFIGVPLGQDLRLDVDAMVQTIQAQQPALVFLSYPNNPTGDLPDTSAIHRILSAAPGLVVVDEAYQPFARSTWIDQLPKHPNLLVLRTVSKLGLAGLRLGYLCGAPQLVAQIDKVRPPYNVNVLTLAAIDFLLDHLDVFEEQAAQICLERTRLATHLGSLGGITVYPSSANFLLIRLPPERHASTVLSGMRNRGVLVKDVSAMHPLLHNCLRITVGTPQENDALITALRATIVSDNSN